MMPKIIHIAKAEPMPGAEQSPPNTIIQIDGKIPGFLTPEHTNTWYHEQAELLEAAIREAVPGGTYDRLLETMLTHKASHFRVSFWDRFPGGVP